MSTPISYYQIPDQCKATLTYKDGSTETLWAVIESPGIIEKLTTPQNPSKIRFSSMEDLKNANVIKYELINEHEIDKSDIEDLHFFGNYGWD